MPKPPAYIGTDSWKPYSIEKYAMVSCGRKITFEGALVLKSGCMLYVGLEFFPYPVEFEKKTAVVREFGQSFFAEAVQEFQGAVICLPEQGGVYSVEKGNGVVVPDRPEIAGELV